MTDKEKIRAEIEKRYRENEADGYSDVCEELWDILSFIDTLQEEPVSEDLEEACEQLAENARKHKAETSSPFFSPTDYKQGVMDGAKWQKAKDESTTEDLGEYINELSKQFQEVSFAKLSRIAVRVAKWQKDRMMLNTIDATCFGFQGAALFTFRLPAGAYLVGSKVKVIVIKED